MVYGNSDFVLDSNFHHYLIFLTTWFFHSFLCHDIRARFCVADEQTAWGNYQTKKNHEEKKILSFLGDTFHSTNISDKAAWEVSLE